MSVSLARLVVTAVRVEGRTKAEVARDYRVSRQWVHELVRLFDVEGDAGLEPRSRRPRSCPSRTPPVHTRAQRGLSDARESLESGATVVGAFEVSDPDGEAIRRTLFDARVESLHYFGSWAYA